MILVNGQSCENTFLMDQFLCISQLRTFEQFVERGMEWLEHVVCKITVVA